MDNLLTDDKHLDSLLRHVKLVYDAGVRLGKKAIENNEIDFGRKLIANCQCHDNSKFDGIEWQYLRVGNEKSATFKMALLQHITTNPHHPEYWINIQSMPRVYLAECVADWYSRSTEFGTDLRSWVKNSAVAKYKIDLCSQTYEDIEKFLDLLLEKPF